MPKASGSGKPKARTVLVVDDEVNNLDLLQRVLSKDFEVEVASSGDEALRRLVHKQVAVIIADMRMPNMNGAEFLSEAMRCQPTARRVLLTAYADAESITRAVNFGQICYLISKPFDPVALCATVQQLAELYELEGQNLVLLDELKTTNSKLLDKEAYLSKTLDARERSLLEAVEALREKNAALEQLALRDGLTGLYNHRSFQERLSEEVARAKRVGSNLSVVFGDVDHFKLVNDTYGHPAGDAVLRQVAAILGGTAPGTPFSRKSDVVARYGGEEFALILPDTSKDGAAIRAERLREYIKVAGTEQPSERITMSFGVAGFPEDGSSPKELITYADSALLRAKQEGRDRVVVWTRRFQTRPTIVHNLREVQGTLGAALRKDRVLCVLSLAIPDLARVERNFGRSVASRGSETFKKAVLDVLQEAMPPSAILAVVSPRSEVLEVFVTHEGHGDASSSRYLDQIAENISSRVEQRLLTELSGQVGLLRVVGSHVRKLFARNVPIEYQLQEVSEEGRKATAGVLERRRLRDKLEVQKTILGSEIQSVVQPIFGAHGRPIAYEALARGTPGTRQESPLVLLDLAEDADLLPELDVCLVEASLKVARHLPDDCLLFVNVLASTIADKAYVTAELPLLVRDAGLTNKRLVLELSERQSVDNVAHFQQALELVRAQGFELCLDDVGTHHANLAEIAAFRPTWLKLDRSLVGGLDQDRVKSDLIRAIVEFGRRQNSKIVAEGVERKEEFELLRELSVEYFQGYLFARPMKPTEIVKP